MYYPVYEPLWVKGKLYGLPGSLVWVTLTDSAAIARLQELRVIGRGFAEPLPDLPAYADADPFTQAKPPATKPVEPELLKPKTDTPSPTLDVNSATEAELIKLPGIGITLARQIIADRPYQSLDQLRAKSNRVNWDLVFKTLTIAKP